MSDRPASRELALPTVRKSSLLVRLRYTLAVLLLGPVLGITALGYLTRKELGRVRSGHEELQRTLAGARAASVEVVKSTYLERTLALTGELDRTLRSGGSVTMPVVDEILRQVRIGRAGGATILDANDKVAWDVDDDLIGRPGKDAYPPIEALLPSLRWRLHPILLQPQPGGFLPDNGLADTATVDAEFWVLTPVAGGRYTVVTHGELGEGRNAAALATVDQSLQASLLATQSADARLLSRVSWVLATSFLVAVIVTLIVAAQFRRRILAPVRHLTSVAERIKHGELDRRADLQTGDELETLGQSLNGMLDRLLRLIAGEEQKQRLEAHIAALLSEVSRASEGDLTARGQVTPDELGRVVDALNHMLESIGGLVTQARKDGDDVLGAAEAIQQASQRMEKGAAQQAHAIDGVSRKIKQLGQRSLEITRIVELVEGIAAQTNLLALNASIEANRAGQGGQGFAVVADEVRKLAERSSAATKDIADFIESIQEATDEAGRAMDEIRAVTRRTADDAGDQRQVAEQVVASARALGQAIARFTVPEGESARRTTALLALRRRHAELTVALGEVQRELGMLDPLDVGKPKA